MIISHHTPLSWIVKYEADSCFLISLNLLPHAELFKSTNWVKLTFWALMTVTAVYHIAFSTSVKSEHQLQNEITVYEQISTAVRALTDITDHYSSLWEDKENMTDISEDEWMKISLLNNWQEHYKSEQVKIYSLSTKDYKLIDKAFDKLHKQNCIIWITQSTPFIYLCFVIWKITLTDWKGCVVVNIKALNWITMSDTYSVLS